MNNDILFDLKLKIAKALMFGLDVNSFITQLLEIENELGNTFKAEKIKSLFYDRVIIDNDQINLSVSMIVKNEEDSIKETLESVKSIADEIIIVDTGSSDNTINICQQYTDKVYQFHWVDDYSIARNYSLDKCSGNWILYIDADEIITNQSQQFLKNNLKNIDKSIGMLITKIINYAFDENNNQYEYIGQYPRVFRNISFPLVHFFGKIHEQIAPSLINYNLEMRDSDIQIIHKGYLKSNLEMNNKVKRNLTILSNHIQEEPTNGYTWYQLGNTLYQMKEYNKSIEILENALKCKNLSAFLNSNTCLALSNSYYKLNNLPKAIENAKLALKYNPQNQVAEILYNHLTNQK